MRYELNKSKFLEPEEFELFKQTLKKFKNRDTLLLQLALVTGARATELLNITKQDLSDRDCSILIKGLKGSKDREIPVKPALYQVLKNFQATVTTERIFAISYSRLVQVWHLYRPVKKKFHSLRHTFAIEVFKKTKDIRLVQLALGHRNSSTTQIYTEYLYSKKEMQRVLIF